MTHARRNRIVGLDVVRLWAAFQMIQGHTIDAVLSPVARHGALFDAWSWMRGLTSITFMFVAGFALHHAQTFAAARDFVEAGSARAASQHRVRRALSLVAIGYVLHAPIGALIARQYALAWQQFCVVDVLQCIGVTLVLLELPTRVAPSRRGQSFVVLMAILCVALPAWFLAFSVQGADSFARPLASYFGAGSRFTLQAYAPVVVLGFASARWCAPRHVAAMTLVVVLTAAALKSVFVFQIALVAVLTHAMVGALRAARSLPAWLEALASETLVLYVLHILLVYGDLVGLRALIGPTLAPSESIFVAVIVLSLSMIVALLWHRLRHRRRFAEVAFIATGAEGS